MNIENCEKTLFSLDGHQTLPPFQQGHPNLSLESLGALISSFVKLGVGLDKLLISF